MTTNDYKRRINIDKMESLRIIEVEGQRYVLLNKVGEYTICRTASGEGSLCGVMDANHNFILPCEYTHLFFGEDGLCITGHNGRVGIINLRWEVVVPFDYDEVFRLPASVSLFVTKKGGTFGLMNEQLEQVLPQEYESIKILWFKEWVDNKYKWKKVPSNLLLLKKNTLLGVATFAGRIVVPCQYEKILHSHSSFLSLERYGQSVLYDINKKIRQ